MESLNITKNHREAVLEVLRKPVKIGGVGLQIFISKRYA